MNDENKTPTAPDNNGQNPPAPQPIRPSVDPIMPAQPATPATPPAPAVPTPAPSEPATYQPAEPEAPAPQAAAAATPPQDTADAYVPPAQPMPQTLGEIRQPLPVPDVSGKEPDAPASDVGLVSVAKGFRTILGAVFSWIIFPLIVVLILHNFVFQAYHVLGTSMYPTLHDSDYLVISKVGDTEAAIGRLFGKNDLYLPPRGQVIVFHYPKDPTKVFVKRVVGLPGERVVVKDGHVTIYNKENPNGFNPDVKYEPSDTETLIDTDEIVQPGNLFVMGDNRTPGGSYDSREWGELPSSYIIGNAVLRLLPLNSVKVF